MSEDELFERNLGILKATLWLAVPLWIDVVSKWTSRQRLACAQESASILAEQGTALMWREKRSVRTNKHPDGQVEKLITHGTRDVFNAVARGMACLCVESGQSLEDVMRQWLGSRAA